MKSQQGQAAICPVEPEETNKEQYNHLASALKADYSQMESPQTDYYDHYALRSLR